MKTKSTNFVTAQGLDQDWKGQYGYADEIVNFRVDPNGLGWVCDRGIESWWKFPPNFTFIADGNTVAEILGFPVDALYIWEKSSTGQVYHFVEQHGTLYYWWGNKGQGSSYPNSGYYLFDRIVIDRNRHIPKLGDIGTQFIPYGNRLLIINGYDKPIWFSGNEDWRDFSFTLPTPNIRPSPIQPSYMNAKPDGGTAFPNFVESDILGLGTIDGFRNQYQYKLTYLTSDGAESPLSSTNVIDWTINPEIAEEEVKFGVVCDMPQGPKHAVARRIYRTKNMKTTGLSGAANAEIFFIREIEENSSRFFIDTIGDGSLVVKGPAETDSSRINTTYKTGATWNNRIWLGGGDSTPTRIIYSNAGIPEQFASTSYFDLGNTQGGHITSLTAYYNNLLVFRRNAIEIIRFNGTGFTLSTLSSNIGTLATNAIVNVPGLGVTFLNEDGVWLVSGGLDGGSQVSINKISSGIDTEIGRINKSALPSAVAAFSMKERELWIHYASDSNPIPNRGIVLHTDMEGAQFSQRYAIDLAEDDGFRFTQICTDPEGNFILGTAPLWALDGYASGSPLAVGSVGYLAGPLVVWTGWNYWGQVLTCTTADNFEDYRYTTSVRGSKPISRWESNWIDFGDNSIKYRVFSVEVELLSYGDNPLELYYSTDYDKVYNLSSGQKQTLSERAFTGKEDPVFGAANPAISKNFFTVGSSSTQNGRIIRLRFDVNTSLINQFKFRLQTTSATDASVSQTPFHLLSFHINYDLRDQMALNQATNLQKGQAR
jgi:hypothetical protein